MKTRKISFILAAALLLAGGLLTGCQISGPAVEGPPILREDLMERTLLVQPVSCSEEGTVRTVDDGEFFNQVIDLCAEAEPFRLFVESYEMKAGGPRTTNFLFRSAADEDTLDQYRFAFIDVEEQLDFGYVHRDKPLLLVGKGNYTEHGIYARVYSSEWGWLYTLPASNYTVLYNLTERYGGGEEIDEWQRWEW